MIEETIFPQPGGCACADANYGDPCVCSQNERALRNYLNGAKMPPMTSQQREWCLDEIGGVEGYIRDHHVRETDGQLASTVLSAWRDYCRDKGFAV